MKRFLDPVENELVVLRLLKQDDLPQTLLWRNQDGIRKWFLSTELLEMENHMNWFNRYQLLDNDFVFVILSKELGGLPVGQIALYSIDWGTKIGEYGRLMIGEAQAKGKGLAKSASQLVLDIGFDTLKLEKIKLEVKDDNIVAISIYRSLGFIQVRNRDGLIWMEKEKNR